MFVMFTRRGDFGIDNFADEFKSKMKVLFADEGFLGDIQSSKRLAKPGDIFSNWIGEFDGEK
jgi:hypothetical protein